MFLFWSEDSLCKSIRRTFFFSEYLAGEIIRATARNIREKLPSNRFTQTVVENLIEVFQW